MTPVKSLQRLWFTSLLMLLFLILWNVRIQSLVDKNTDSRLEGVRFTQADGNELREQVANTNKLLLVELNQIEEIVARNELKVMTVLQDLKQLQAIQSVATLAVKDTVTDESRILQRRIDDLDVSIRALAESFDERHDELQSNTTDETSKPTESTGDAAGTNPWK